MRMASRSLSEARVPKIDLTSISNMEKVLVNALTAAGFTNAAPSSAHRGKDDSGVEVSAVFADEFEKAIQIKLKPGKAGKYHIIPTMDEIDFDLTGKGMKEFKDDCEDLANELTTIYLKAESDEDDEDKDKKDNKLDEAAEGDEYEVLVDQSYTNGGFVHAKFHATSLANAVKKLADHVSLYFTADEIVENKDDLMDDEDPEEYYDGEEAVDRIISENGDGCDYIIMFKNVTQNKVFISTDGDTENWDD